MKAMRAIRPAISTFLSVAVIVMMIFACKPFVETGINGMLSLYAGMADAVITGNGSEYADGIVTKMDTGSQAVIGDLGSWATGVVEQAGGSEFLDGITDYVEGCFK